MEHTSENPVLNSNTEEVLVDVPEYEGIYKASSLGYITNGRKILRTYTINSGYKALKLVKNGVRKSYLLHRLIAICFLENPEGKPEVNHKDGDKGNCCLSNLEWSSSSENKQHARSSGLWQYNTPSLGKRLGRSSRFRNVIWDSSRQKWIGTVRHNSKNHFPKRFDLEEDAAKHVNWILDTLGLTDRPRNCV